MDLRSVPQNRYQFYRQIFLRPVWLVGLAAWTVISNADNIANGLVKPNLSPETWKQWEPRFMIAKWPWYIWLIGALLILLIGAVELAWRLYGDALSGEKKALTELDNYKLPKLKLSWIPNESPYRWWDMKQSPPALYFGLCVKNSSGVPIDGIKVELEKVEPVPDSSYAPCPLRLRHNILPSNEPIREFSLNPGDTRFAQLMIQAENLDFFWMLTAIDTIPDWVIPMRPYRFHVRVSSSTPGPEASGTYELYRDGNLWNMKEIIS